MTDKKHAIRIGMFAFISASLVTLVVVVFGGFHFWRHRDRYYIEYSDSASGLSTGVGVSFNGIPVGNVSGIDIAPGDLSHVRVTIDVDEDTQVRTDTTAMMNMSGITGLKVIDLRGGALTAPPLAPGSTIPAGVGMLDKLSKQAETIADQSAAILKKTRSILDGVDSVVANLKAVSDPAELAAIIHATRSTAESLAKATHEIDALIAENRTGLHDILGSVSHATDGANQLVGELRTVVHTNGTTLQSAVLDFRQAARTFKDFARELRDKPSRLMFSSATEDRRP